MIVLHKKRIVFIASCFVFSICAFYLFQNNNFNKDTQSIETVSLPVSNKVIVLDARTWNSRWRRLLIEVNTLKAINSNNSIKTK